MVKIHGLTSWLRVNDRVTHQSHVDSFLSASITSLGGEDNLGEQSRPTVCLAIVSVDIAFIKTVRTSGYFRGSGVILASWFADIVETIGFTVFTINSLTILIKTTDSGESNITVSVSLTFVGDFLTGICV